MTKYHVGQSITVATSITNAGTLTDPTSVTFIWRINRDGADTTATVTNPSTGVYEAAITPDKPGLLYGKWTTTGTPLIVKPIDEIPIHDERGIKG